MLQAEYLAIGRYAEIVFQPRYHKERIVFLSDSVAAL